MQNLNCWIHITLKQAKDTLLHSPCITEAKITTHSINNNYYQQYHSQLLIEVPSDGQMNTTYIHEGKVI